MASNANAFQPNLGGIIPPHLQWLDGNQQAGNNFGYGKVKIGPRGITIVGATQNAGSEKKEPSKGSYDYVETMRELDRQHNKRKVEIQMDDQIYILKNPYRESADELGDKLADQMYD